MTKNDWIEAMKKKPQHTGMLFPPLEPKNYATLPAPSADETKILEYAGTIHDLLHKGTLVPGHRAPTPWRMVGERKVVGIEIETYSGTSAAVRESSTQQNGIDIPSMFLDKSLFPLALWKEVFEGENLQEGNKRKREEKEREWAELGRLLVFVHGDRSEVWELTCRYTAEEAAGRRRGPRRRAGIRRRGGSGLL
ncbi:hypothetical protein DB88DRAFT_499398 [Papiliotrema laurentii]|uniref:Uncharacterized protein n=1 Tax=Papiliotrema laurentii TaxID=5418 RepID=A0AAD9CWD3_PAPLA|nr:hypothetical protein DB88DRAFT_499398 [Papiliotrema laurentii]